MPKKALTLRYFSDMKKLISIFVKYPFYANVLISIMLIVGTLSFLSMKRSFFPEMSEKDVFVTVFILVPLLRKWRKVLLLG